MSSILVGLRRVCGIRPKPIWVAPDPDADLRRPRQSFEQWLDGALEWKWKPIVVCICIVVTSLFIAWLVLSKGYGIKWLVRLFL